MRALPSVLLSAVLLSAAGPAVAHDGESHLPPQFEIVDLPEQYGIPVNFTFAPDGQIFLADKKGLVWTVSPEGVRQDDVVIDLRDEVNMSGDRGLLGIVMHPGFTPDGGATSWMYLVYTVAPVEGVDLLWNEMDKIQFGRLTRYRVITEVDGDLVADEASRHILLGNQLPDGSVPDAIANVHSSHANGTLAFADDGTLMLTTGDGAHMDIDDFGGNDPAAFDDWIHPETGLRGPMPTDQDNGCFRAQNLASLAGKVLRLDPETGHGLASNPFFTGDVTDNASRVFALGLRNGYHMTLLPGTGATDPSLGQPNVAVIGDVGWKTWEELDVLSAPAANFGWPCFEGLPELEPFQDFDPAVVEFPNCNTAQFGLYTPPVLAYEHKEDELMFPLAAHVEQDGSPGGGFRGSAVIGGAQYAGGPYPDEYDGRLFFGDFREGWIKTVEFDAQYDVVEVRDFTDGIGRLTDIERHPVTGNLWFVNLDDRRLRELRYSANLTPVVEVEADVVLGAPPLVVQFDGSGTEDPEEDAMTFEWDFGDGSPTSRAIAPSHVYTTEGNYLVKLTVTDVVGNVAIGTIEIDVGEHPPVVEILSPLPAQLYDAPSIVMLDATATDPGGAPIVSREWNVDLYHDTHVHPSEYVTELPSAPFPVDLHGGEGEVYYYRVDFSATDVEGLTTTDSVYIYPLTNVRDVTGEARLITKVQELSPPWSEGTGNIDPEVMRDGVMPPVGSTDVAQQYDTFHNGDQGDDDWIGIELLEAPTFAERFVSLTFQEGVHAVAGGWWEDFEVEVRTDGEWEDVHGLRVDPPYPFDSHGEPDFDGVGFETYTLTFEPTNGDAIRLRGKPGGNGGFVTCAELRASVVEIAPTGATHRDITDEASAVIARVDALSPPGPQGLGNPDAETIRNGTQPEPGSPSIFASYDTYHPSGPAAFDWVGYTFDWPRTIMRVVFGEGRHSTLGLDGLEGGAFDTLAVQVQLEEGGPWGPVSGLGISPPYAFGVLDGTHYDTYTLDFDPILVRGVRLAGRPSGADGFASIGELRVFEPVVDDCGWRTYGTTAAGANTLSLFSPSVPTPGASALIVASGAEPGAAGALGVGLDDAWLPAKGGVLLVQPSTMILVFLGYDAAGQLVLPFDVPSDPLLDGVALALQAFSTEPADLRFSNGLELTLCAP